MGRPVIDLREFLNAVETVSKEVAKDSDGNRYLVVVVKSEDGTYAYYWHDEEMPTAFHDFATGIGTAEEARQYALEECGAGA
jgi:hypothetical protein